MASKFNGFSQDEINKATGPVNANVLGRPIKKHVGIRRLMPEDTRNHNGQIRLPGTGIAADKINRNTKSVQPTTAAPSAASNNNVANESDNSFDLDSHPLRDATHFQPIAAKPLTPPPEVNEGAMHEVELVPKEPDSSPFRGVSLKDFEQQRMRVEEQNKQKINMLQRAIEQHSKKTAEEAKRLEDVRKELDRLDSELAADVAILRKQIETATIQFSQVQKHYDHMEQLFLKAKINLHQAIEKKELLTEHLCTIIAHNEDRKAKKLSDLMEKVGLTESNGETH